MRLITAAIMKKHIADVAWSDVRADEIIAATEDSTPAIAWPYHKF